MVPDEGWHAPLCWELLKRPAVRTHGVEVQVRGGARGGGAHPGGQLPSLLRPCHQVLPHGLRRGVGGLHEGGPGEEGQGGPGGGGGEEHVLAVGPVTADVRQSRYSWDHPV